MTINQKHVDKLNKLLGESKPENIILKSIEEFNDKVVYVCSLELSRQSYYIRFQKLIKIFL